MEFVTASIDCVGLLITGLLHEMRKNHANPETELYRSLDTATRLLAQAMEVMVENGNTTESPEKSLATITEYLKNNNGK